MPKKIKKNIFNMSIGSRQSTISGRSHNSVIDRNQHSNTSPNVHTNSNTGGNKSNSDIIKI